MRDIRVLLREAKSLIETAPISVSNTTTNRFWRSWVEKRKSLLTEIEQALQETATKSERREQAIEEIAQLSQDLGMYD